MAASGGPGASEAKFGGRPNSHAVKSAVDIVLEELTTEVAQSPAPKDPSCSAGVRRRCAGIFKAEAKAALASSKEAVSLLIASVPSIVAQEFSSFQTKNAVHESRRAAISSADVGPEKQKEVAPELTGGADPSFDHGEQLTGGIQKDEDNTEIAAATPEGAFKSWDRVYLAGLKNAALNGKVGSIVHLEAPMGAIRHPLARHRGSGSDQKGEREHWRTARKKLTKLIPSPSSSSSAWTRSRLLSPSSSVAPVRCKVSSEPK